MALFRKVLVVWRRPEYEAKKKFCRAEWPADHAAELFAVQRRRVQRRSPIRR
jgi:hypothetical protein